MRPTMLLPLFALLLAAPARAAEPGDPALHFEASFEAEGRREYGTALNEVLEILRVAPGDYVATLRAGWLYYLRGQHEDAIVTYRKAVGIAPKSVEARMGLTLPLMAMGRWKETEEACAEALKLAPGDIIAMQRIAYAQYMEGSFAAAKASYERVLAFHPSDIEMMLGLGWTELKLGNMAGAKAEFQRVLRIRRDNLRARAGLEACQ